MAIKRAIVRYLCAKVRKSLEKEMKKVVFVLITILFTLQAQAQESQEAFSFLRLPVSAHVAALGGDNITIGLSRLGENVLHGASVRSI